MTTNNENTPAAGSPGSGGTGSEGKPDTVTREAYDNLLSETKKEREARREKDRQLDELLAKEKARGEKELADQKRFEELAASKDKELQDERIKRVGLENAFKDQQKLGAVLKAIGKPVDAKWHAMIDIDQVTLNSDGSIDQSSVKKYADDFSRAYPETLGGMVRKPPPGENGGGGSGGSGGKIDYSDWEKLPSKERKARMKDIDPSTIK